jgi:hypothetical protein
MSGPYFQTELAQQGIFSNINTITPSNDDVLPQSMIGIYVAGAGNVAVLNYDGTSETFPVLANSYHPVRSVKILSTGTTASGIRLLKG